MPDDPAYTRADADAAEAEINRISAKRGKKPPLIPLDPNLESNSYREIFENPAILVSTQAADESTPDKGNENDDSENIEDVNTEDVVQSSEAPLMSPTKPVVIAFAKRGNDEESTMPPPKFPALRKSRLMPPKRLMESKVESNQPPLTRANALSGPSLAAAVGMSLKRPLSNEFKPASKLSKSNSSSSKTSKTSKPKTSKQWKGGVLNYSTPEFEQEYLEEYQAYLIREKIRYQYHSRDLKFECPIGLKEHDKWVKTYRLRDVPKPPNYVELQNQASRELRAKDFPLKFPELVQLYKTHTKRFQTEAESDTQRFQTEAKSDTQRFKTEAESETEKMRQLDDQDKARIGQIKEKAAMLLQELHSITNANKSVTVEEHAKSIQVKTAELAEQINKVNVQKKSVNAANSVGETTTEAAEIADAIEENERKMRRRVPLVQLNQENSLHARAKEKVIRISSGFLEAGRTNG